MESIRFSLVVICLIFNLSCADEVNNEDEEIMESYILWLGFEGLVLYFWREGPERYSSAEDPLRRLRFPSVFLPENSDGRNKICVTISPKMVSGVLMRNRSAQLSETGHHLRSVLMWCYSSRALNSPVRLRSSRMCSPTPISCTWLVWEVGETWPLGFYVLDPDYIKSSAWILKNILSFPLLPSK